MVAVQSWPRGHSLPTCGLGSTFFQGSNISSGPCLYLIFCLWWSFVCYMLQRKYSLWMGSKMATDKLAFPHFSNPDTKKPSPPLSRAQKPQGERTWPGFRHMSTPEQVMAWGVGFLSPGSNHILWSYMESGRPTSLMEQRAPCWQQKGHEKTSCADTQSMVDGLLSMTGKEWVSLWTASEEEPSPVSISLTPALGSVPQKQSLRQASCLSGLWGLRFQEKGNEKSGMGQGKCSERTRPASD